MGLSRFTCLLTKIVVRNPTKLAYKVRNTRKKGLKAFYRIWPSEEDVSKPLAIEGIDHIINLGQGTEACPVSFQSLGNVLLHLLPSGGPWITNESWKFVILFTLRYFDKSPSFRQLGHWLFWDQHFRSIPLPQPFHICYQLPPLHRYTTYFSHWQEFEETKNSIFYLLNLREPPLVLSAANLFLITARQGHRERTRRIAHLESVCSLALPASIVHFVLLPFLFF